MVSRPTPVPCEGASAMPDRESRPPREQLIWLLAAIMGALGIWSIARVWTEAPSGQSSLAGHGWAVWQEALAVAVVIALGERMVVMIRVRDQGIASSMAELPLALTLLLAHPAAFLLGRAVGTLPGLFPERWRPGSGMKLAYNVTMLTLGSALTWAVYAGLLDAFGRRDQPDSLAGAVALLVAITLGYAWINVMIVLAMKLVDPEQPWQPVARALWFSGGVTLALSLAGVYLAILAYRDAAFLWLDAVAAIGLYSLLRIYGTLGGEYVRLQKLYDFSRELTGSTSVRAGAVATLEHGARLLEASQGMLFVPWADDDHYWLLRDGRVRHLPIHAETARAIGDLVPPSEHSALVDALRDRRAGASVLRQAGFGQVVVGDLMGHSGTGWLLFESVAMARDDRVQRNVLENVASQSATALGRTELVDQLREENLQRQREALHDRLTTLPNRDYFVRRLEEMVASRGVGEEVAVLIIDLDHFKEVNDSLGHQYGDLLLREVGRRLSQSLRSSEFLARLGGDEFGVLLHDKEAAAASAALADRIAKLLEQPVDIADTTIAVGGSIGIAFCPRHAEDPATLMRQADIAMYAAKRDDLRYVLYEAQSEKAWLRRLEVLGRMRAADFDEVLDVHFQPQVDLASGEPVGMEALARWTDPDLGAVSPVEFIPVAEQSGLIRPLTMVVIEKSMDVLRRLHAAGHELELAVNLSGRALLDLEVVGFVAELLEQHRLDPDFLTIEVTESVFVSDSQRLNEVLVAYEDLGVHLSIDDFGTGYSSLSYLRRLPARELKIDRSFVDGMVNDGSKLAIVRSTVALAHELGLSAVAEGIEDVDTMALLRRIGCDVGQGYLLGRPMPETDLLAWLRAPTIPPLDEFDHVAPLHEAGRVVRPAPRTAGDA